MQPRIRQAVAAAGMIIVLGTMAACTDETNGDPQSPAQTSSSSGTNPSVPRVTAPLNAEPFLTKPCGLLDNTTVSELGGKTGVPDISSDMVKKLTGPTCNWDTGSGRFDVTIQTVHRDKAAPHLKGIAGVYASKDNFPVRFEPTEIPGHAGNPAVVTQDELDGSSGRCLVHVGIADDLVFIAGARDDDKPEAGCQNAMKVATGVLDTLEKGA